MKMKKLLKFSFFHSVDRSKRQYYTIIITRVTSHRQSPDIIICLAKPHWITYGYNRQIFLMVIIIMIISTSASCSLDKVKLKVHHCFIFPWLLSLKIFKVFNSIRLHWRKWFWFHDELKIRAKKASSSANSSLYQQCIIIGQLFNCAVWWWWCSRS